MKAHILGILALVLFLCGSAVAQTTPPIQPQGSATPGPAAPRAQTPGTPPRDGSTAQTPPGTGRIRGHVIAADSGNPLRRAQVRITASDVRVMQSANTDGDGRYEFASLPAGRYSISVTRTGYVTLQFGQQRPFAPGKPLNLADGEVAEKIDFALPRDSVIAGRITDELGEPQAGARVQAMRYQYMPSGQRQLIPANIGMGGPFGVVTDDLGQFRVYGLIPGTYILSAHASMSGVGVMSISTPAGGVATASATGNSPDANDGYVATYYPGTANPDEAQAITVGLAQETMVSFSLIPARMSRVSGIVRTSQGRPAAGAMVQLRTVSGTSSTTLGGGMVAPDGTFNLTNIPPGEHFIDVRPMMNRPGFAPAAPAATPGAAAAEPEFASLPITASGQDITGLVITTTTGTTVSGRLVFPRTVTTTQGGQNPTRVLASSADPGTPTFFPGSTMDNGLVDEAGRFQIRSVNGRVIFRPTGLPPGWFLKSVTLDGADLTDIAYDARSASNVTGLEVLVTDQRTTLSGGVRNSRGDAVKDYVLAVLPDNLKEGTMASRFIRSVRPDQNGQYKTQGLPVGDYVAFAVESMDQGTLYDPAYQQEMKPRAKSFRLNDGQTLTLDLQLVQ